MPVTDPPVIGATHAVPFISDFKVRLPPVFKVALPTFSSPYTLVALPNVADAPAPVNLSVLIPPAPKYNVPILVLYANVSPPLPEIVPVPVTPLVTFKVTLVIEIDAPDAIFRLSTTAFTLPVITGLREVTGMNTSVLEVGTALAHQFFLSNQLLLTNPVQLLAIVLIVVVALLAFGAFTHIPEPTIIFA